MKAYITGSGAQYKEILENLKNLIKLEWDENGVQIETQEGEGIDIVFADNKICITYPSLPGLFRALILCRGEIEKSNPTDIHEKVYIKNTGVMPDFSRNGVMTVSAVKEFAAQMAVMGLNQLYLYMEDTYTVDEYPYLGYMRGRYTKEELKEIDDYCNMIGIEAIPHIQVLGHMAQFIKWDEGMRFRDTADILIAGEDNTYEFIEKAIASVSSCFRTKKIHLGCDEAGSLGSGAYYAKNGYRDRKEILLDHIVRVSEICEKYSLEPIIYGDILFAAAQGNNYASASNADDVDMFIKQLPQNLSIVYWSYGGGSKQGYSDTMNIYKKLSDNVIYWGGIWTWFGFVCDNAYTYRSSDPALLAAKENKLDTVVASIWGDNGCECDYFQAFLGIQLYAEHMYNKEVSKKFLKERFELFTAGDYDVFMGISEFHNRAADMTDDMYYVHRFYGKRFIWADIMIGVMDKELADRPMSGHYASLVNWLDNADNHKWNWLYDYYRKLCTVAHTKCLIAEQLQPAYKNKNKVKLQELAEVVLPKLRVQMKELRDTHKNQWLSHYKPFGFEVLDVRYGGILSRIDYAMERLEDYLGGRIDVIDELETERLPHTCEWTQKNFSSIITSCFNI